MTARYSGLLLLALCLAGAPAIGDNHYYDHLAEDEKSPFYDFKQNGVETYCTVPRLGVSPRFGNTDIAPNQGATITDAEAQQAYACIRDAMLEGYLESGYPAVAEYQDWRRFSTVPYASRAHSTRYVHNYANRIAAPYYARYEQSGRLPEGAMLAKDSFVVTRDGRVVYSALAIMEKMPPGFNPSGGDWRYTLILPDGRLFGSTGDRDAYTVQFCQECHQDAGEDRDFLFFMPKRYRVGSAGSGEN